MIVIGICVRQVEKPFLLLAIQPLPDFFALFYFSRLLGEL